MSMSDNMSIKEKLILLRFGGVALASGICKLCLHILNDTFHDRFSRIKMNKKRW